MPKAKKKAKKAKKPKAKKAKKKPAKKAAKPKKKIAPAAAVVAPAAPVAAPERKELVGTVEHYYGKIGVAVVKASAPIRVGDKILIERGEGSFTQTIESMEIEHQKVQEVKPGDSFGLLVKEKATEGNKVYKVS